MKRGLKFIGIITSMLILCFAFGGSHAESALEAGALVNVSLLNGSAVAYEQTQQQLYVLNLADGAVKTYPIWSDDGSDAWHEAILFTDGRDSLRAIEAEYAAVNGKLCLAGAALCQWKIAGDGIERTKLMDVDLFDLVEDFGFQEQLPRFRNTLWDGSACYMLLERENSEQKEPYVLASDGRMTALPINHVQSILRAQDQKIMYARSGEGGTRVETYDLKTGDARVLLETAADLSKAYYSIEEQAIYYIGDMVYKVEASDPKNIKAVGRYPFFLCSGLLYSNENLVFYNENQISVDCVRDMNSIHRLKLAGYIGNLYDLYSREYPGMALEQTANLSGYEITSNMLARNGDVDIYIIRPDDNLVFKSLRDRGYCAPLTSSAATEFSNTLYDEIRSELCDPEGRICALPMSFAAGVALGIDRGLWESLGFGDVPQSWDDFFCFLETDWRSYNRANADVRLLPCSTAEDTRDALFYMMKANYDNYREQNGNREGYSSSVYQNLLNRFMSIDFESFQYVDDNTPFLLTDWYLVTPSGVTMSLSMGSDYLSLSIDGEVKPEIVQYPGLAFINPYSEHQEAAQEFMGFLAENMGAEEKIMLQPANAEAIKSEIYDEIVARHQEIAAQLNARYEAATEESERYQIQQDMAANEANLQENIRNAGYTVSPEGVALYKKLISENGLSIQFHNEGGNSLNQLVDLSTQLMQKHISVERYTSELDRIIVQEELENQ